MSGSLWAWQMQACEQACGVKVASFVETGTCRGDTADQAATIYDTVLTIEASPELVRASRERLANRPNVTVIEGRSEEKLAAALACAPAPRLVYLDAHQTQMDWRTAKGPVPLEAEMDAIRTVGGESLVIVDDCRLIGTKDENDYGDWTVFTVESLAKRAGGRFVGWLDSDRALIKCPA